MSSDEIAQLRSEIARLQSAVDRLETDSTTDRPSTTRRALLGSAVAAGGAALLGARTAQAGTANGESVDLGEVNVSSQTTEIRYDSPIGAIPRSHVFVVQDGAWQPQSPNGGGEPETGTRAAVGAFTGNDVLHGFFGQTNTSVLGSAGGRFRGQSAFAYGIAAAGRRASMRLLVEPEWDDQPAPPSRFDFHNEGEITIDSDNDVWLCVTAGNPGTWRKIGGPASAGAFHAVNPTRVYDSRITTTPSSGKFAADTSRVISVKDGRDPVTGAVSVVDLIPSGATAITYNVSVTQTTGSGYVFVAPGDATAISAATINWSSANTTLGNAGTVKLDGNRRLRIFSAVGATHVIIDVTGFYR